MPPDAADAADAPRHDAERQQFTLSTGNLEARLVYRRVDADKRDYHHTFVPPALRGRGIASRLTRFALDHALQNGLSVVPTCPFVAAYIESHPRYREVLSD